MKQSLVIGLTLIFLLLFNCASASILDITTFNNSNEENIFKLSSYGLDGSENLGKIIIDGVSYELPNSISLIIGELYVIGYVPEEGYVFDHWEIEGGELKSSEKQQANILKVTNSSGKIIAIYRKMKEETIVTETITETTEEEYELPLGKLISLSLHEIIEEHKSNISFWIFEHKLIVLEKDVEKLEAIEAYQNDFKQKCLEIKEEMRELKDNLTNGIITEEEFIVQMEILRSELLEITKSNEKLGHILGEISKEFSEELRERVEERKRIHSEFKEELNNLKEEVKTEIMRTKTKILKTEKTIHTKTPPGQTKKTTTTKTKDKD